MQRALLLDMHTRRLFSRAFTASAGVGAAAASSSSWASPGAASVVPPSSPSSTAWKPARKFRVGVLGATGAVGQRFLEHLDNHPWFEVVAVGASERSVGKAYGAAANWLLSDAPPARFAGKMVVACEPNAMPGVDFVFSALVSGGLRKLSFKAPKANRRTRMACAHPPFARSESAKGTLGGAFFAPPSL